MTTKHLSKLATCGALLLCIASSVVFASAAVKPPVSVPAEWTVMVYMLGRESGMECHLLENLAQMSSLAFDPRVHVLVEIGRVGHACKGHDTWRGVRIYRLTKKTAEVCQDSDCPQGSPDMGSANTLSTFLRYARRHDRARHYALIIRAHGLGSVVYDLVAESRQNSEAFVLSNPFEVVSWQGAVTLAEAEKAAASIMPGQSPFYVSDLRIAVQSVLGRRRLDLIGFDSCLMATVETMDELQNVAELAIANEDLEPLEGWPYNLALLPLTANPQHLGPKELARNIATSYSAANSGSWPLSIVQLRSLHALGKSFSRLADVLECDLDAKVNELARIWDGTTKFEVKTIPDKLDVASLMKGLSESQILLGLVRSQAQAVQVAMTRATIGTLTQDHPFVPGLTIYFPEDHEAYGVNRELGDATFYNPAYCSGGEPMGVALRFGCQNRWPVFLYQYLRLKGKGSPANSLKKYSRPSGKPNALPRPMFLMATSGRFLALSRRQ